MDKLNKKCTKCKKGNYIETSIFSDIEGFLHCSHCGIRTNRYSKTAKIIKPPKEIFVLSDPNMTLFEWQSHIRELIKQYGGYTIMFADAGYNNVSLVVKVKDE